MIPCEARALVLAVLAGLVLLTGCSNDSVRLEDYRRGVRDLFAAFNEDLAALSAQVQTDGTPEEVFASLGEYARAGGERCAKMLADWDVLPRPERAEAVHGQGRRLIEGYRTAFDRLAAGAAAADPAARDAFNAALETELPALAREFQDALNALQ